MLLAGLYFCTYHWMIEGLSSLQKEIQAAVQQRRRQQYHIAESMIQSTPRQATLQQCSAVQQAWAQIDPQQLEQQQQQQHQSLLQEEQDKAGGSGTAAVSASAQPMLQFLAGGMAGAIAWASVYPVDVVKSRMQVRQKDSHAQTAVHMVWPAAVGTGHDTAVLADSHASFTHLHVPPND